MIEAIQRLRPAIALTVVLLCSCSGSTPDAVQPVASPPADSQASLPPTPTFTPTEQAFAANVDPLTGLPSEIEDIAQRPLMAYAIDVDHGAEAPAGVEAVELVVEHPPDPQDPGALRLTALSRLQTGERPNLGPLGAATELDLDIARAFGADLTVLSLDPNLDAAGVAVTRFSAADDEAVSDASSAGAAGSRRAPSFVPWSHVHEAEAEAAADVALAEDPPSESSQTRGARSLSLGLAASLPGSAPEKAISQRWGLDPLFGIWMRFSDRGQGMQPMRIGDPANATFLQTANLVTLRLSSSEANPGWKGSGTGLGFAGARPLGELSWSRVSGDSGLTLELQDGEVPTLNPGSIWMVLWPEAGEVQVELDQE